MKLYTKVINECSECANYYKYVYGGTTVMKRWCRPEGQSGKDLESGDSIPDWCPLETVIYDSGKSLYGSNSHLTEEDKKWDRMLSSMTTFWQTFTVKEKLCWHLHSIVNRLCWSCDWRIWWLKELNDRFADGWLPGYWRKIHTDKQRR